MDTTATAAGESAGEGGDGGEHRAAPDQWETIATLTARTAADEHPDLWAATGLPHGLADLDVAVETVWAAVQLATSGADHTTLAHTLDLTDDTARRIIIATTEQLLTEHTPDTH